MCDPVSVRIAQGSFGDAAYLGKDIKLRKLRRFVVGSKGVLLWGLAEKLPSRVFVEQFMTGRSEQGNLVKGVAIGEVGWTYVRPRCEDRNLRSPRPMS